MNELLKKMKEVNEQIVGLEAKRADADEAEANVYQKLIDEKKAEFSKLEGKVAQAKETEAREKLLAEVEAKRNETDGKSKKLADVVDSEHNDNVQEINDTKVFTDYFTAKKVSDYLNNLANQNGADYVDSRMAEGGMKLPKWMAKNVLPTPMSAKLESAIETAMIEGKSPVLVRESSGTNTGGGSLVEELFNAELFKIPQRTDSIPDACYVKRGVGKEVQFPRLTQSTNEFGVSVTWGNAGASSGEGSAISQSDPTFTRVDVNLERLSLLSKASLREVRVNQVGFEAELMWMYRGAANRALSKAILQGVAGVTNAPTGINTNASITAGVNVLARQTAAQVSYTDLVGLQYACNDGIIGTGMYVISAGSTGAMKYIASLDDTYGRPVFAPEDTWGMAGPKQIAGAPFISTLANSVALGGRGDVIFGNFSGFGLALDNDVVIERSDEYAFNQGLVTYRMIMYAGGELLGPDMFAVLGDVSGVSSSSSSSSS